MIHAFMHWLDAVTVPVWAIVLLIVVVLVVLGQLDRKNIKKPSDDDITRARASKALAKTNEHYSRLPRDFEEWKNGIR